jgi:hypothetical protein
MTTEQEGTLSGQLQAPLLHLFGRARGLLENFLQLVEKMRIRTVLEDERDIVLELCDDLVSFHKLLITIDLKSSLKVTIGLIFQIFEALIRCIVP